jgi:hypothetical protein
LSVVIVELVTNVVVRTVARLGQERDPPLVGGVALPRTGASWRRLSSTVVMLHNVLQVALDPRVWLGGVLLVFGGIVAFAEISQHLERRKKPPAALGDEGGGRSER